MTTPISSADRSTRHSEPSPVLIGLIGGVASGKSTVARLLAQHGALWLDCDQMAHDVLKLPEVIAAVEAEFSDRVIDANGLVDRKQLAALVFGDDDASIARRRRLEQILHPRIRARCEQQIADAGQRYPAIIIDAPLLLEAGWGERCDHVVLVEAPLEQRQRLAASRGWSPDELSKRERSQLSLADKRRHATDTIDNSGSLVELEQQVQQFWQQVADRH